jgi:signal transduction histidine kinase
VTSSRRATAVAWLSTTGSHLEFTVTDDGTGFDTAKATCGTGLQSMADRLAAAGGTLRINSAPGLGTTISGGLPVSELAATGR